jgi:hypothetical protein
MQAFCRYGPAKAYLPAGDLYTGDIGSVRGRNANSSWLYIKFDKLTYFCWAAASVLDIKGDVVNVYVAQPNLPKSSLYGPVQNVWATRQGDQVTVSWDSVYMTDDDDQGYFIEGWLCQDGAYFWTAISLPNHYETTYTFTDQAGCSQPSNAMIYVVEKHGYTDPVTIPWLAP